MNVPLDKSNHTYSIEVAGNPGFYWRIYSTRYIVSSPYNATAEWKRGLDMPPSLMSNNELDIAEATFYVNVIK